MTGRTMSIVFLLLFLGSSYSLSRGNPADPASPGTKKPDRIHMTADKLTYDDRSKTARLINNVRITYGETIMTSRKADFNGITKVGHFTGGVKLWQPGNIVTGDRMDAFYAEKRGVLIGHVRAIMESSSKEGPAIMTCEEIEFFWESQDAIAKKGVKIWRRDKTAYADTIHYSKSASLVTLTDNVRFEREEKDWLTSPEAYLDLKTNTFVARGGVEGTMMIEEQKTKKTDSASEGDRILMPPPQILQDDIFMFENPEKRRQEERIVPMPDSPSEKTP